MTLLGEALRLRCACSRERADKERRLHHHRVQRGEAVRSFRMDRRGRLAEVHRALQPLHRARWRAFHVSEDGILTENPQMPRGPHH